MEKVVLLALAASLCTATASVCQRAGARNTGPAPSATWPWPGRGPALGLALFA